MQSYQNLSSQANPEIQIDYKAEYKKMKAKLLHLEVSLSTSQNPKAFKLNNKGLVAKTFDWDEEGVLDDEEVTQRHIMESIWYLDSRCSRSMTGVKSYLHKCVKQPGLKIVFSDNSSCIAGGYGSRNREENVNYQSSERLCNLSFLEYLKLDFIEYEHVAVNSTLHGLDTATIGKPTSLAALAVLVTGASQSRQHDKSEPENVNYQSSERLCNLSFLEYLKLDFIEYEHVAVNSTLHGLDTATIGKPTSLAALAVLVTGASQSRQHDKSEPIPPVMDGSWERIPILKHLITPIK
nr:retrovirus-related Pol polyprotein from transposon TNT 1-94 [Tanacetum cinerariifolium]